MADAAVGINVIVHVLFFADLRRELLRPDLFVVAGLDESFDPFLFQILQILFALIARIAYDPSEPQIQVLLDLLQKGFQCREQNLSQTLGRCLFRVTLARNRYLRIYFDSSWLDLGTRPNEYCKFNVISRINWQSSHVFTPYLALFGSPSPRVYLFRIKVARFRYLRV